MSSKANIDGNNDAIDPLPPGEWVSPLAHTTTNVLKRRKCGYCSVEGHNRRKCPLLLDAGTFTTHHRMMLTFIDLNNFIPIL
jgi:hypothetical protein